LVILKKKRLCFWILRYNRRKPQYEIRGSYRNLKFQAVLKEYSITSNERPRVKPRGITERNPQERRRKSRFLQYIFIEKARQAAGYSSSHEIGINMEIFIVLQALLVEKFTYFNEERPIKAFNHVSRNNQIGSQ
jgi:hypothetical protein